MKFKIITISCLFLSLVACNGGSSSSGGSSGGGSKPDNPSSITASQFASNVQTQIDTIKATGQSPFLVAFDQEKGSQKTYFMSMLDINTSGASVSYQLAFYDGSTLTYFTKMPANFSPYNMQVSHGTVYLGGVIPLGSSGGYTGGLYSFSNGSLQKINSPFDSCNSNCGIGVVSLSQDGDLLIGGWSDSTYSVYEYQPLKNSWINLSFTTTLSCSVQGITYQGENILIGGSSSNSACLFSLNNGIYRVINSLPSSLNGGISTMTTHNNIPRIAGWKQRTATDGGYSLYRLNNSIWEEVNVPELSNQVNQLNNLASDSFGNIYGTIWINPGQNINTGLYLVESAS